MEKSQKTPQEIKNNFTYHLLFRYSETYAPKFGTIKAHRDVIEEKGHVWFAKFGLPLGKNSFRLLEKQIVQKKSTYLFIVKKKKGIIDLHCAEIKELKKQLSIEDILGQHTPLYYNKYKHLISTGFKVNKILSLNVKILQLIEGSKSKLPIINSLKSMHPLILSRLPNSFSINEFIN